MVQIPRLREWRELQGWTQKDLAQESGVSPRSIAGYEAGAGVRPGTARKLAEALGVEVADLVLTSGKAEAPPSPEQPNFNGLLEEERRADWDAAVRSASQLREDSRARMEDLLASWRESQGRGEASGARRAYLDEMGDLLQQAYDAETTLWETLSRSGQLLGPDELSEIQAARSFYDELWPLVQGAGLRIHTGGAQQQESAQQEQLESHIVEERSAA